MEKWGEEDRIQKSEDGRQKSGERQRQEDWKNGMVEEGYWILDPGYWKTSDQL